MPLTNTIPPRRQTRLYLALALLGALLLPYASASPVPRWTATWGSSQLKPSGTDVLPLNLLENTSLRQVVHISIGGSRLRLHLSNAFGQSPLVLHSVRVGRGLEGKLGQVAQGSDAVVHFNGETIVSIPAGAEYTSDPISMSAPALSDVVVTMLIEKTPETLTFHAGSRATSFLLRGDHVADVRFDSPQTFAHWYFLAGLEVESDADTSAVVTLGDSITDGHGATTDANDRWTDVFASRLASKSIGVVNQGIGGNRILHDGLGPSALARFDRDVLGVPGARSLIIFEGVNDLGGLDRVEEHSQQIHDALVLQLEAALQQMTERAHAHGIRVYGGTITPYRGSGYYHPSDRSEADRQSLNRWIRTSHVFDGIIDFDALLRDPAHPDRMAAEYDSGDHLHPGPAGYKRMGEGIPLSLFKQ
jgi:lysophospholipase L1-like esterase